MKKRKKSTKPKARVKTKSKKHKHSFRYFGGAAKCSCGKYLQPDGRITNTMTGRPGRKTSKRK